MLHIIYGCPNREKSEALKMVKHRVTTYLENLEMSWN